MNLNELYPELNKTVKISHLIDFESKSSELIADLETLFQNVSFDTIEKIETSVLNLIPVYAE
ncbi:MAG: hypothetical protein DRJ07_03120 [Bacteroidetes bacterium]|nr:MAG: hypothetical protein DRJ07_03120 [Bacteroidota bacterium]